jgi:2-desacetyl-2-hydroxyethyl bacteriochlorophyllide A dehydrogenase
MSHEGPTTGVSQKGRMKKSLSLWIEKPGQVALRQEEIRNPSEGEVLVRGLFSALSHGTEKLIYLGQVEENISLDVSIPGLGGKLSFPLKYGYSNAGVIEQLGKGVDKLLAGRKVFSFQPHQSYFVARLEEVFLLNPQVDLEDASLFPSVETAFTLLLDGNPRIGESVLILGQGTIGLLLTRLLARTRAGIISADTYPKRRRLSRTFGALSSLDPSSDNFQAECLELTQGRGFDLIFEVSGNPEALRLAFSVAAFEADIVVGSWYGRRPVNLGTAFHRGRFRIKSSQVSTLPAALSGRWTKARRHEVVWKLLEEMDLEPLISHHLPLQKGAEAFKLLENPSPELVQIVFTL